MHAGPYLADSWLRNGILENLYVTIVVEELILGLWYPYYYKCFCENTLLLNHTYIMFFQIANTNTFIQIKSVRQVKVLDKMYSGNKPEMSQA